MTITAIPLPDALDALYGRLGHALVALDKGTVGGVTTSEIIEGVRRDLSLLIDACEKAPRSRSAGPHPVQFTHDVEYGKERPPEPEREESEET